MCNWKGTDYYYSVTDQVRDWASARLGVDLDGISRSDAAFAGFIAGVLAGAVATWFGVEAAIGGALFWI